MLDIRQTKEYSDYLKREGWTVERIDKINYFLKKIPILGSILKIQHPERIDLRCITVLVQQNKVFQIIVEPKDPEQAELLAQNGYKLSKSPYLPTKTLQIDLAQRKDHVFASFKKDARLAIRSHFAKATRDKEGRMAFTIHECSTPKEIKNFRVAWKNCVNLKRHVPSTTQLINLRKSFPQSKSLFLTSHNIFGSIIGGVIFTTSSHDRSNYITYYWSAFTNSEGRTLLSQYTLLYQGILWAKKNGSSVFDFEGIYDERFPNKSWLGFSHFKRSFGGYEVEYPGCYIRWRLPV